MYGMNIHDRTVLLLSGLGGNFILEWMDIYECIAANVAIMYSERMKLANELRILEDVAS